MDPIPWAKSLFEDLDNICLKAVEIQLTNTDTGTKDFREGSWEPFPVGACYITVNETSRRDHTPATVTE